MAPHGADALIALDDAEHWRFLLRGAEDPDDIRRYLSAGLDRIYAATEAAKGTGSGFYIQAATSREGKILLGVNYLRGIGVHRLVHLAEARPRYPGPTTYPGEDTFPGSNVEWLAWPELQPLVAPRPGQVDRRSEVEANVAGLIVAATMRHSIAYLRSFAG